ncbi:hypothetical protein [Pseudomonas sp. D2002]|uniref:hypothetical protein n=1 Tax=Pseudomonas sp. D2002 TaxID=2726980 RepID=UPI0015A4DCEF|nr:hypothetical protein [Pseudomonas sp. D2002]NWA86731.1 hypothetical protein [Pseudomonas sp. D2002]
MRVLLDFLTEHLGRATDELLPHLERVFIYQQIPVALVLTIKLLFPATSQPLLKNPGHALEKRPVGFF